MGLTSPRPRHVDSPDALVDETIARVGKRIVLGTPLGLGKPNHLLNAFYRRAEADSSIRLTIYTALTLSPPAWSNELERRLVEPLNARLFGDYPEIAWVGPQRRGKLPANVEVREFYFPPGAMLRAPGAQRSYIASNYSHVVRDLMDAGLNVLAQAVGTEEVDGSRQYSLSCNSDLTVDLLPLLRERQEQGERIAVVAQVNRNLPFMYGDAMVSPETFDFVLDRPEFDFALFGTPNLPIDTTDYGIALNVSALIRDGGTLQIGIGSLGDAIVGLLQLRHQENAVYRRALEACGALQHDDLIATWGGAAPFSRGLYAATEMLVDGFMDLYRSGILTRRVYPHAVLQRLLDAGEVGEEVTPELWHALVTAGGVPSRLAERDVIALRELGIFRSDVRLEGDALTDGVHTVLANPSDDAAREDIARHFLGERLRGGRLVHAGFFLGPRAFYEQLAALPREERELIEMTGISFVNELYGQEELKRAQRRHARFVNTAMMVTLNGSVVSDGLEDGRVVSGVGGQYNFVAMAHELEEGRSIIMVRSTRTSDGDVTSNIVWNYGHVTIPRHLRDIVVTEYGIADLRGRTDEDVIAAMLAVADSRFQDDLLERAKRAGKIAPDYEIPERYRRNLPERLDAMLEPFRKDGHFAEFPFGTDLTDDEIVLTKALRSMRRKLKNRDLSLLPDLDDVKDLVHVPGEFRPYLERMGLAEPDGIKETLLQRSVVFALLKYRET